MKVNLDSSKPSEIILTGVNLVLSTEDYDLLPKAVAATSPTTTTSPITTAAAPAEGADAESGGGVLGGVGNLVNMAK